MNKSIKLLRLQYGGKSINPPDWKVWIKAEVPRRGTVEILYRIFLDENGRVMSHGVENMNRPNSFRYVPDPVANAILRNPKQGRLEGPDDVTYSWQGTYRDW